jgi:hypothetical protein
MKVLFKKFYRGKNLVALLFNYLASRNETRYSEILKFENLKGLYIQSLKLKGHLRIACNMWKVFTRPTCASDFFISIYFYFYTILNVLKRHFPTKLSKKVSLQKQHYLEKHFLFFYIKASKYKNNWKVRFTGYQNGNNFQNG